MEVVDTATVSPMATSRTLLVSLHDVSPLTLDDSRTAVTLLREAGLRPEELTVLVIPRHEDQLAVDRHPETVSFLRGLADEGACLVMHGLTHRMSGRALTLDGFVRG